MATALNGHLAENSRCWPGHLLRMPNSSVLCLCLFRYACMNSFFCLCAGRPEEGLPDGWAVAYDPNGKPYYWHKATQKTQWDRPTA